MDERRARQYSCCAGSAWTRTTDLGHTKGIEFTLGQCSACGRHWMHLWTPHAPEGSYVPFDSATATRLTSLQPGPALRRALEELFDL